MLNSNIHIIGIGLEKCGTTTAFEILSTDTNVMAPQNKETFFFNRHFNKGYEYYRSLYPSNKPISIDITPSYHLDPEALQRIATYPGPKRVVLFLRDPIQRAFSLYRHDIFHHFATGHKTIGTDGQLFKNPHNRHFYSYANSFNYYFVNLATLMDTLKSLFKEDDLLIVYFDEIRSGDFLTKIEASIGYKLNTNKRIGWANKSKQLFYEYSSVNFQANGIKLPPSSSSSYIFKLMRQGYNPIVWRDTDISQDQIISALAASQYWTQYVTESEYDDIFNRLYKNMDLESYGLETNRIFDRKFMRV